MASDAFIQCRVTPETKAAVRALAAREQITESALVKQLLEVVLRTATSGVIADDDETDRSARGARISVRLHADDRAVLEGRASRRGMRSATYVSVLVRAHLRHLTPIPKDELAALRAAIAELRMVGRTLNQIARLLNQGQAAAPGRRELQSMLKVAEALREHVKALLVANEKSWEQGYATNRNPH